jgi:hypothetical protein
MFKSLQLVENRFTTDEDLPRQDQHTCEVLSTDHIDTHHLTSDPWRTGPVDSSRMEILVHLGREIPPDDLE